MKQKNIIILSIIFVLVVFVVIVSLISRIEPKPVLEDQPFDNVMLTDTSEFSDGLPNPTSVVTYPLDEFDMGISEKYTYKIDINNDGKVDKITKTFFDTGNAHAYYKYTIELNKNSKYVDITPDGLQTTNGADCDLRQIQFRFKPSFQITVINREMGDTWDEPTTAYKKTFSLQDDKLTESKEFKMRKICDVKELF